MITVEVKDTHGKVLEYREFSVYDLAVRWYESAVALYGDGVSITFNNPNAILR